MTTQTDIWGLTLTFGYDLANNLTTETDSLGGTVTNTYNTANEITEKQFTDTNSDALSVAYSYDAAGQLTEQSRYSDASETTLIGTTSYGYDNADRTTSIIDKNAGGTTIDSYDYTYNSAGRVATETSTLAPSATYTYDPDGQLLSDGTNSYTYDPDGNRTDSGYATTTGNELTTDGTWDYTYDAAGNMTEKVNISTGVVWLYSYNNANELVQVQEKPSSGGSVDYQENYTYDVLGNLIVDTVYPTGSGSSTVTRHAYDPLGNSWADLTSGGSLIMRRLYNDAVDALLARIDGNGVAWYLTDNLGSVRDITNSSGSIIDHRDYDAWGNLTYESNPSYGDRYGFTGREFDVETGLEYNRARWYDPSTGRWESQDPLGFGAGDSNLYRYVSNDPENRLDPTGMQQVGQSQGYPKGGAGGLSGLGGQGGLGGGLGALGGLSGQGGLGGGLGGLGGLGGGKGSSGVDGGVGTPGGPNSGGGLYNRRGFGGLGGPGAPGGWGALGGPGGWGALGGPGGPSRPGTGPFGDAHGGLGGISGAGMIGGGPRVGGPAPGMGGPGIGGPRPGGLSGGLGGPRPGGLSGGSGGPLPGGLSGGLGGPSGVDGGVGTPGVPGGGVGGKYNPRGPWWAPGGLGGFGFPGGPWWSPPGGLGGLGGFGGPQRPKN